MCDFPSWRELPNGKVLFLTDKDIQKHGEKFPRYSECSGHTAISKVYPKSALIGKDKEGSKDCPQGFLKAIRVGECQKMMENAERIDFDYTNIKGITFPKRIKGHLFLKCSNLNSIVLPEHVLGHLDLMYAKFRNTTLPKSVGEGVEFCENDLRKVVLPEKIKDFANFQDCNLSGVTLPSKVGGILSMYRCNLKGAKILQKKGEIYLSGCTNIPPEFHNKKNIIISP